MMASDWHTKYANEVLGGQMDPEVYKEVMDMEKNNDFDNPKYGELLMIIIIPNIF
jgi:proline iminopeptidase